MAGPLILEKGNSESKANKDTLKESPKGKETSAEQEQSEQDLESNNSYNQEDIENNPTPDIIDIAYYTAWVQYRLAGLDLYFTRIQTLDQITSQRFGKTRLSQNWSKREKPGLTVFVQDLLDTTVNTEINNKISIVRQILQQQKKQSKDLRKGSKLLQIVEKLSEQQVYKVTSYKTGLLIKTEFVQYLIYNKNPDIDIKIYKTIYQSFCNNNYFIIYIIKKCDYNY